MDLLRGPRHSNTIRSFNGCWSCRLRRKKCDGKYPLCDTCTTLHITCHYDQDKPEWMDGGVRQEEMVERLKREVKENAHRRYSELAAHTSSNRISVAEATNGESIVLPHKLPRDLATSRCDLLKATSDIPNDRMELRPQTSNIRLQRRADCPRSSKDIPENIACGRSDTILLMFYLENLFPFLFPFYHPPLLQGGRAWILEMMISSPVVRNAILCQSSYFFSLAQGMANWETVLTQTKDAFGVLRQALQVIDGSVSEHTHGAVRIMASIMQVQRFEIAALSFSSCQIHLSAALALFRQLLESSGAVKPAEPSSSFKAVMSRLGPSSWLLPAQSVQVPSAEQVAFRFSSALLILDDIIASTMLQQESRLYEYHRGLLQGAEPVIDLEAVVGCQNWALLHIGETAVLDAWKQRCKRAGNLDVMELVHRATAIKESLKSHLTRLETEPVFISKEGSSLLDVFTADYYQQSASASQSSLATRVWAHAALLYLFVVVSGWQPASNDVRYHVGRIIELLTHQISPPALLRTMVWPFCVAGCLAEPAQEAQLRGMVEALQPSSVFGTVHKAFQIMENVWRNRDAGDAASRDFATCFRSQGDLVLLV